MAGFWKRVGDILGSNINDVISKMEDPEKMLPYKIDEMKEQLREATDAAAEAMATMKSTEMRLGDIRVDLTKYNIAAESAAKRGDDELAKRCLARVLTLEKQEKTAADAFTQQDQVNTKLKDVLKALQAKIEEAELKMDELVARSKAAKAQEKVVKTIGNMSVADVGTSFEDLERKVIKQENKVAALAELGSAADTLDDEIAKTNQPDEIEMRLKRLKGV